MLSLLRIYSLGRDRNGVGVLYREICVTLEWYSTGLGGNWVVWGVLGGIGLVWVGYWLVWGDLMLVLGWYDSCLGRKWVV